MELQILPAGMNVCTFFSLLNDTRSIHGKKKSTTDKPDSTYFEF